MAKKIFTEEQKSKSWDMIAILSFLSIGLTYRFIEQNFISGIENAMPISTFLPLLMLLLIALTYFIKVKLSVRMTKNHISFSYYPWKKKRQKIKWENVTHCEIVQTPQLAQWNGWNVHFSNENVFSLSGRSGLSLTTEDGNKFFIGSRNIKELSLAIKRVFKQE